MVLSDIVYEAAEPKGWVLNPAPTEKERAFCRRLGLNLIVAGIQDLLGEDGVPGRTAA